MLQLRWDGGYCVSAAGVAFRMIGMPDGIQRDILLQNGLGNGDILNERIATWILSLDSLPSNIKREIGLYISCSIVYSTDAKA